ncbi:unnamed protein product, partial [Candidula unifasciata]
SNYTSFITWKQAERLGYTKPYRTTPNDWTENLHLQSDNYTFEVGVDSNCDTYPEDRYCNGPLPGGKSVIISVVVCTKAGCDYVQAEDIFVIKKLIFLVTVVLLYLVFLVTVCFALFSISSHSLPIKMRVFEERVKKLHKDSNLLMQSEFEDIKAICKTFKSSCSEAQREANRVKNRYVDILPYDHSRVKLNVLPEDEETNDFINANYIPGLNSVREYIATQGPMQCTISDFWRMIWEQKCQIIVMVSDLQENGRGMETRKVTQFFLPGWCDFSANVSFDDVLELVQIMRQEVTPDTSGPITVHCSAGVGRTGTFIALDYFMQYVHEHSLDDDVDIYDYVLKMRRNRPRMVQAESQYIFIYDAVQEMIKKKIQQENERLYNSVNSESSASLVEREPNENSYVDIQLDEEKCAYINEAF